MTNKTKLSTHIPFEYIKSDKRIRVDNSYTSYEVNSHSGEYWLIENNEEPKKGGHYRLPAPTIADIIDNAEELFGRMGIHYKMYVIIDMCLQNKSIEEISEYILDNIIPTK